MGLPAAVKHTQAVLDRMVTESDETGEWRGRLTEVVAELGASPHYSVIRRLLTRSGAAEQVSRGGGSQPSIWHIHDPKADIATAMLVGGRVPDVKDRMDRLEDLVGGINVPRAIADLAQDIAFIKQIITKEVE